MKTAEQYKNKSPEEIVGQYRKGLRMKQGLLILILLLYMGASGCPLAARICLCGHGDPG